MTRVPDRRGLAWFLAAKVVCCGGLLLVATGALSLAGLGSWFFGDGITWLAIAGLVGALLYLWRRQRAGQLKPEQRTHKSQSRRAT
jgi:membrane protein implicated in regulation of membrane protease activity